MELTDAKIWTSENALLCQVYVIRVHLLPSNNQSTSKLHIFCLQATYSNSTSLWLRQFNFY